MSLKVKEVVLTIDEIEAAIGSCEQVECPVVHTFTPGLYAREITMPAGVYVVSKIHKTEHPYVVTKGKVKVWMDDGNGVELIKAPYKGITKPGTRRVLTTITETVWTTYHPIPEGITDLKEIETLLIEPHINPEIGNWGFIKNKKLTKKERS